MFTLTTDHAVQIGEYQGAYKVRSAPTLALQGSSRRPHLALSLQTAHLLLEPQFEILCYDCGVLGNAFNALMLVPRLKVLCVADHTRLA